MTGAEKVAELLGAEFPGVKLKCYEQSQPPGRNKVCIVEAKREESPEPNLGSWVNRQRKHVETWELIACRPNWVDAMSDARAWLVEATLRGIERLAR